VAHGEGLQVLIVDDDPSIRLLLRTVFELEGWQVHEAADGETGLAEAARLQPDGVVLDVMMPGKDGFEVLAELRATEAGRSIAVVMLTAKTASTDILRGTRLGADQYLTKPCDPDEVVARLGFHVLRRQPERRADPTPELRA
jgi:two-component system OmpR family response regulator